MGLSGGVSGGQHVTYCCPQCGCYPVPDGTGLSCFFAMTCLFSAVWDWCWHGMMVSVVILGARAGFCEHRGFPVRGLVPRAVGE